MRSLIQIAVLLIAFQQTFAYSKYGRSCKDIGCLNSEECIMAEDPCSYYNRDQCGKYPTCKPAGSTSAPSCNNYQCPPTQICHLDDGTPKCVPDKSSSTRVEHSQNQNTQSGGSNAPSYPNYPAQNPSAPAHNPSYPAQNPSYPAQNPSYPAQNPSYPAQNPSYPAQNPSYPSYPGGSQSGSLYPSLPSSRPANAGGYPGSSGGGYPGGAPNSGYPGQGGYPSQGGYPGQGGYPSQSGYPSQGYPSQSYPSQSGYPSQGQRYPQYPSQGQYPGHATQNRQQTYASQPTGNRYGTPPNSGSNPIVDKITDSLKTIGLFCVIVKYLTTRVLNV